MKKHPKTENKEFKGVTPLSNANILDALLDHTPAGVAILEGPEFIYKSINKNLAKLNGLSVKDHLGRPLRVYVVKTYRTDRCLKLRYTFL